MSYSVRLTTYARSKFESLVKRTGMQPSRLIEDALDLYEVLLDVLGDDFEELMYWVKWSRVDPIRARKELERLLKERIKVVEKPVEKIVEKPIPIPTPAVPKELKELAEKIRAWFTLREKHILEKQIGPRKVEMIRQLVEGVLNLPDVRTRTETLTRMSEEEKVGETPEWIARNPWVEVIRGRARV